MANIIDTQTVGEVKIHTTDTDPRLGGGTPSEIGSICLAIDGSGLFTKVGSSDTDYITGANPYGELNTYFLSSDFDTGALPTGWNQATNAGGTTDFSQANEGQVIGIGRIRSGVLINGRCGIQYSNAINYLNRFTDALYTLINFKVRWDGGFPTSDSCCIFGWLNTNASVSGQTGNTLAIMYDPSNISGYNTGGITNLFLLARATYGSPAANTLIDLGVLPNAVTWDKWSILYNNIENNVKVILNNNLITTLTDLSNVPAGSVRGNIPVGSGIALLPCFYVGNSKTTPPLSQMSLRVDKVSVFRVYN